VPLSLRIALPLAAACVVGIGAWIDAGANAQDTATDRNVIIVHVVRNGHPAQGRVTIRDEDGGETSCEVNGSGECELSGIVPGRHVVEATGPDGTASGARAIMVPQDGKVSLIVQLPQASSPD